MWAFYVEVTGKNDKETARVFEKKYKIFSAVMCTAEIFLNC